ncbi:hypothetical protein [Thiobacillus sp.]|uniref:hypothetical protein n=1 Tax=Thiobacillus sp. TaxID=924 RepID=UPI0011D62708|nr:hypothetical protein [Thiobacillus sp.]TXH73822.1 MAG: hypothetical protein E6Q82_12525 [Thiobacillus sp.]
MSLLLFLFYWIAIPVLVISAAAWLWRRIDSFAVRGLIAVACIATLSGLLWLAVGEKWLADRQVRALCAKDGGVRVYETVVLPAEKFDEWGNVNIPNKKYAKSTDEYYYESEDQYYRQKAPRLLRMKTRVIRRSDGKVLGESIRYARSGGDLPGPWHESSFGCPPLPMKLESSIFLKGIEK